MKAPGARIWIAAGVLLIGLGVLGFLDVPLGSMRDWVPPRSRPVIVVVLVLVVGFWKMLRPEPHFNVGLSVLMAIGVSLAAALYWRTASWVEDGNVWLTLLIGIGLLFLVQAGTLWMQQRDRRRAAGKSPGRSRPGA